MGYPLWDGAVKEPLLLIGKSGPCGGSRFPLSLSEWSFTICQTSFNHKENNVEGVIKKNISSFPFNHTVCFLVSSVIIVKHISK